MNNFLVTMVFLQCFNLLYAQKHAINEKDYLEWKRISNQVITENGDIVSYSVDPLKGDSYLYIQQTSPFRLDSFERASDFDTPLNNDFAVFKITPGYDTLRKVKLKKIKKAKWPKDTLGIYDFSENLLIKEPGVSTFSIAKKGNTLAYIQVVEPEARKGLFSSWFVSVKDKKKEKRLKVFYSYPLLSFDERNIKSFVLSPNGERIAYIEAVSGDDDKDSEKLVIRNTKGGELVRSFTAQQKYKLPVWSASSGKMAFFFSNDTIINNYQMTLYDFDLSASLSFGDTLDTKLDSESVPSHWRTPFFSKDEDRLFFGIHTRAVKKAEDSLLEEEKYHLDVWHYMDHQIQPQQKKRLRWDKKKNDLYVYNINQVKLNRLSNDTLNVIVKDKYEAAYALAYSNESYAIESQWSYPWKKDYYLVSLDNGDIKNIKKNIKYPGVMSPNAKYFTYFDEELAEHQIVNLKNNTETCITCSIDSTTWTRDINGMPIQAGPVRTLGFTREDQFIFQSKWDIWSYDPVIDTLICITERQGEQRQIQMSLYKKNRDSVYIDLTSSYVYGLNKINKSMHLFNWLQHEDHYDLIENMISPHRFQSLVWSGDGEKALLRKSSVHDYPNVELVDKNCLIIKQISNANPQQKDVLWPSVELVNWLSYDSIPLEGLVYIPENYDTTKRYPLMVYYYELNSDNLHNYRSPKPSASIINPIEYASNDYLVFVPDIRYVPGYPARSAYNSIMSGTDHLIKNYAVDSLKMGLQGQSWGGYQTAQLITMTARYAAAMAGAPVSNMFSAYGGIRWGSGLNRQFQYEATQSRIGKTIWEAPELYYENSPIFHLPKVSTPLLIMHNDKDGAVPWYQGIELYNGMRRLQKPCWMLVYNNDDHNLRKLPNKFDLSIRMNQFFDHYLKGSPQPKWMKEGIPALEKDKRTGYELDEK